MKIDSHQHFWNYDPKIHTWIVNDMGTLKRTFKPEDLKPELDKAHINGTIAIQSWQSEKENDILLKYAKENDWIKGVVGWVDLMDPNVKEKLSKWSKNDLFKGVRHFAQEEKDPDFLLNYTFNLGVSYLKDYNLSFDVLIDHRQLKTALEFVQRHPYTRMVMDHMAKPLIRHGEIDSWKHMIADLSDCDNLYLKLSGLVTEADWKTWKEEDMRPYLDVVFEYFGTERLMFGSGWPVCLLASPYQKTTKIITNYIKELSKEEQTAIMGGNAVRFYQLWDKPPI